VEAEAIVPQPLEPASTFVEDGDAHRGPDKEALRRAIERQHVRLHLHRPGMFRNNFHCLQVYAHKTGWICINTGNKSDMVLRIDNEPVCVNTEAWESHTCHHPVTNRVDSN